MKLKVETEKLQIGPKGSRKKLQQTRITVLPGKVSGALLWPLEFLGYDLENAAAAKNAYATIDHEFHETGVFELKFWYRGEIQEDLTPLDESGDGAFKWGGQTYREFENPELAISEGMRGVFLLNGKKPPKRLKVPSDALYVKTWEDGPGGCLVGCLMWLVVIVGATYFMLW